MFLAVQAGLIFDLGIHKGCDAEFDLKRGFRVISLEAVPEPANYCSAKLVKCDKKLTIINTALFHDADMQVTSYTTPCTDDSGSLHQGTAENGVDISVALTDENIAQSRPLDSLGVLRPIKCDTEGRDIMFRPQLLVEARRPRFISVEMNDEREGIALVAFGSDASHIVNLWLHSLRKPHNPSKEADFAYATLIGKVNGKLGLDLIFDKWWLIGEVDGIYKHWKRIRDTALGLSPSWFDSHGSCLLCLA